MECNRLQGFNPCCFGSLVRAPLRLNPLNVASGFNPCCFGSLVRAQGLELGICYCPVSILVVLDHWFGLERGCRLDLKSLVSILVVLDHWFGLRCLSTTFHRLSCGFNPCCFGSLVRASQSTGSLALLLLSFNPCCFGSLVRAFHKKPTIMHNPGFNPCCFGSLVRAGILRTE